MNRIEGIFGRLRESGRRAVMPFVCGGHPVRGGTGALLEAAQRGGAAVVEVGIPFSDPVADGPVIAAAMHRALESGVTPEEVFSEVRAARERLSIGVVAMVSVSLAMKMGEPGRFVGLLSEYGFDGFILPDVPLEEARAYVDAARRADVTMSLLISPTTPFKRAQEISQACSGFVYLLTRTGITGTTGDPIDVGTRIEKLRQVTELPIACGFGISTAEQVSAVLRHADAAIVGSALVRELDAAGREGRDVAGACEAFVRGLVGEQQSGERQSGE